MILLGGLEETPLASFTSFSALSSHRIHFAVCQLSTISCMFGENDIRNFQNLRNILSSTVLADFKDITHKKFEIATMKGKYDIARKKILTFEFLLGQHTHLVGPYCVTMYRPAIYRF